ncbi:zinc finger BED domain-containing protein RICESLEEPER 2-like [Rosa chinensis]|uniref:zinc finger BED domain-containing protein RICESLEEPER 2-like n=1 Tax=Rosa chinensis TaxID=74649 RepID=UPI000D089EFC|nr:zinc finger BED domain-containing protein RICESLEEPER 2-like [Rosa chinensis]
MEGTQGTPGTHGTPTDVTGSSIGTTQSQLDPAAAMGVVPLAQPASTTTTTADTAASEQPATDSGPKRKNKSIAWDHFTKLTNPDGSKMDKPRAKCNYCPQTYYVHSKSNGTLSMRNHMLYTCRKCPLYIPAKKQKHLVFDYADNGGNITALGYEESRSRLFCAKMIIRDELPFSFVEAPGFIDFVKVTQPLFKPPSCRQVVRDIWDLYQGEKTRIKNILATYSQRVSLTIDTWTSIQNVNYMVLTAHFIDENWVLHKRILNFIVIPNHKGKTIGKLVESCLIGWGIEKVFTIVVDNVSPNQVALDYMKEKIGNWKELVLNGQFLHMRCCCHILNLIVKDVMEELDSSIDAIRNCVKYIRSSPARLEKFRKCDLQEKVDSNVSIVPLDVCTRWNSTYFMLDITVKFRKAFLRLEDEDSQFESYFQEMVGGKKRDGPPLAAD